MPTCRICLKDKKRLAFQTDRISICQKCVTAVNEADQPALRAESHIADLLRQGMIRNGRYTLSAYLKALPGWMNRLLADPENGRLEFLQVRALRRGLLRREGVAGWDYPADWIKRAARIRQLDGRHCRQCGATDAILDIHHIVYLSHYGTNQQTNLITLCRACHEKVHDRIFDWGEENEPGNTAPIQPRQGQRTPKSQAPPPPTTTPPPPPRPAAAPTHAPATPQQWAHARAERDAPPTSEHPSHAPPPPIHAPATQPASTQSSIKPAPPQPSEPTPSQDGRRSDPQNKSPTKQRALSCPHCAATIYIPTTRATPGQRVRCAACRRKFSLGARPRPAAWPWIVTILLGAILILAFLAMRA